MKIEAPVKMKGMNPEEYIEWCRARAIREKIEGAHVIHDIIEDPRPGAHYGTLLYLLPVDVVGLQDKKGCGL